MLIAMAVSRWCAYVGSEPVRPSHPIGVGAMGLHCSASAAALAGAAEEVEGVVADVGGDTVGGVAGFMHIMAPKRFSLSQSRMPLALALLDGFGWPQYAFMRAIWSLFMDWRNASSSSSMARKIRREDSKGSNCIMPAQFWRLENYLALGDT